MPQVLSMEPHVLQLIATFVSVLIVGCVVWCTQWLIGSQKSLPPESFPLTSRDKCLGLFVGLIVGAFWCVCDLAFHYENHDGGAPLDWVFRLAMLLGFVT